MLYYGGPDYNYFYPGQRCDEWGPLEPFEEDEEW